MTTLYWLLFAAVAYSSFFRTQQASGQRDTILYALWALAGALAVAAAMRSGWIHFLLMAVAWFALPFAFRRFSGQVGAARSRGARNQPSTPAEVRAARLRQGEISVAQYREEGGRVGREQVDRLTELSREPEIAAILRQRRISFRQFSVLRELLSQIPDQEWTILGTPALLEELIELSESGKNRQEVARHFRAQGRRPSS